MSTNSTSSPEPPELTVQDMSESLKRFGVVDYTIFLGMLLFCTFIGIYFGWQDHKRRKRLVRQDSDTQAADYLMGGRDMPVIPVALSLTASLVSGNMLLGKQMMHMVTEK
jgi:Na+/proline symporter